MDRSQQKPIRLTSLPTPKQFGEVPPLHLADLIPRKYCDITARVVFRRVKETEDELGKREYLCGILEDRTFKTPFISHSVHHPFEKNSVVKISKAYAHEFEDRTILVIINEYSKVLYLPEENPSDYIWKPEIGLIHRPVRNILLKGLITNVFSSSGLVRRCNTCNGLVTENGCFKDHKDGWYWDVRIAGKISDISGSMKIIFGRYLTSKILDRKLSEIFNLAQNQTLPPNDFKIESFRLEIPQKIKVFEATVVDPLSFRSNDKIVVPELKTAKIYFVSSEVAEKEGIFDVREKKLHFANDDDYGILTLLIRKALDIKIREITSQPYIHGIYLLEEPVKLYGCEKAKLYLGIEVSTSIQDNSVLVEACPRALIRESLLNYIEWRRGRGASAKSIRSSVLKWRRNVVLAPGGSLGRIEDFLWKEAKDYRLPNDQSLPDFWKDVYDIEVDPEEKPLVIVKPYNLDIKLTYPPSTVFFDQDSIYLRSNVLKFVEYRGKQVERRVFNTMIQALHDMKIGDAELKLTNDLESRLDAKRLLLDDVKLRVYGRTIKARGSVVQIGTSLYFIPRFLLGMS